MTYNEVFTLDLDQDLSCQLLTLNKMLKKKELDLKINPKRDKAIITPCCNKTNHNGKFVNFINLPNTYGYCHSCGTTTLPPTVYINDSGDEFVWNELTTQFETVTAEVYHNDVSQMRNNVSQLQKCDVSHDVNCGKDINASILYIDFELVVEFESIMRENALLMYMRSVYGDTKTDIAKKLYHIGSSKKGGAVFWKINKDYKVQKAKVCFYKLNGKRTKYFKSPFLNKDGYIDCLFGEHLLNLKENLEKTVVLVESEKTAIICSIMLPNYVWLAYGGINGLTNDKASALVGKNVVIVPDMSENAVSIIKRKLPYLSSIGVRQTLTVYYFRNSNYPNFYKDDLSRFKALLQNTNL